MDSKDWVLLKAIHEEGSLTKAAERLYTSQPSLSYRLANLEGELGVRILDRQSDGVTFTRQGEHVLRYAEEMIARLEAVKNEVLAIQNIVRGRLSLGVSSVYARFKLAPILKTYRGRYPEVAIDLRTGSSTLELPLMLRSGAADVVILRGDLDWPEQKQVILEEPYGIISAEPIEISRLPESPCILDDAAFMTHFDALLERWWSEHLSSPWPPSMIKVDSVEASIQLASHGMGWTVQSRIHLAHRRSLFFCPLTWMDGIPLMRKTYMAYREKAVENPAVRGFVDLVLDRC